MAKKNEAVKVEEKAVAPQAVAQAPAVIEPESAFQFELGDVTLPRLLLAQKTSKVVENKEKETGQIYNSLTSEVLGGVGKDGFEVIPLSMTKLWTVLTKKGNKFIKTIPFTSENKELPWEGKDFDREGNQVDVINQQTFQFMVLILKGLEEGEILPAQLSFKSKSLKAGKDMGAFIMQLQAMDTPTYMRSVKLSAGEASNDSGTFCVWKVSKGEKTTLDQQKWAKRWMEQLKTKSFKVDEDEVDSDPIDSSSEKAEY